MTENNAENPEHKTSAGSKSLVQLLIVMGTAIPAFAWDSTRPYAGGDGDGTNFLMGFLMFLFWFPMLVASFCYGITAITHNKGRTKGIVTVSTISLLILWVVVMSLLYSS